MLFALFCLFRCCRRVNVFSLPYTSQAMEATLSGAVVLTKVLLPTMLDRKGGHVVVVGGDAPLSPPPKVISGAPHYCSTPGSCFFFWSFWTLNFGGFLG